MKFIIKKIISEQVTDTIDYYETDYIFDEKTTLAEIMEVIKITGKIDWNYDQFKAEIKLIKNNSEKK